jgi:hypothetical protein
LLRRKVFPQLKLGAPAKAVYNALFPKRERQRSLFSFCLAAMRNCGGRGIDSTVRENRINAETREAGGM